MIIYLTDVERKVQDIPFNTDTIKEVIDLGDNTSKVFDTYWNQPRIVAESKDYIMDRVENPEKFNPIYVVSCRKNGDQYIILSITRRPETVRLLRHIFDGEPEFKIESYETREDNFINMCYANGAWWSIDMLMNTGAQSESAKDHAFLMYNHSEELDSMSFWKGMLKLEHLTDNLKVEHIEGVDTMNMTRDQALEYMCDNRNAKIKHESFCDDEYIYMSDDGNIYDENNYLFENWVDNHDGMRIRQGGVWETGWSLWQEK